MSIKFPPQFQDMWRHSLVKAAFVSDIQPTNNHDCPNCGGVGSLYTFVASAGPFTSPSGSGINHYHDGKWWVGQTYPAPCPVCGGNGRNGHNGNG